MKKIMKLAALAIGLVLAVGCSGGDSGAKTQTGDADETLSTYFFDFSLEGVEVADSYEDYTPAEGNKLLLVKTHVKNDFGEDLPMFDTDFQVQWGTGEEDYAWSVDPFNDEMMPAESTLAKDEEITYFQVYEVPADIMDYTFVYLEEFDDDTTGDFHEIQFTVDK